MTPSGIEPATTRLVARCLSQLRYDVPPSYKVLKKIFVPEMDDMTLALRLFYFGLLGFKTFHQAEIMNMEYFVLLVAVKNFKKKRVIVM